MREFGPPWRFLLRGSMSIVVLLAAWWLVLVPPLVALLGVSTDVVLFIWPSSSVVTFSVIDSGDWTFRVPTQAVVSEMQINNAEFTVPRAGITSFTFSLPIYWALVFAMQFSKREIRPFISMFFLGGILVALLEALWLVTFVKVTALNAVAQAHRETGGFAMWLRELSSYLAINVAPFLTPFVAAAVIHPKLRSIFTRATA